MKNRLILTLLFIFFSFTLLAQTTQNNRTLRIASAGDIEFFSPWDSTYTIRHKILWNIYDTLVILDEKSTQIKPNLAVSWESSNNNRTWILKLRDAVKFHDGSYLTADDVVASASQFVEMKLDAEKVDRLTIRFILPEPHNGFLHKLTNLTYAIAPAKTVQEFITLKREGRLRDFNPVGSGPFRLSRHDRGRQIVMTSFPDYWQGTPEIRRLIYRVIPDNKNRISALERGDIDLIDILFPVDLSRIKKNPQLNIISMYGMNLCYLSMNTTHRPFNNKKVRQAINLALDKLRITRMFYYGGYGVPTNRILSPAFWGFKALPSPGRYQPAVAKKMLAEAGYNTGSTQKMICIPRVRQYLPDPQGVAKEIKKQLAAVGVKVNVIVPADFTEYDSVLSGGNYDMVLTGWIDVTGDPDYTLSLLLSGRQFIYNNARWQNDLFNKKLQQAREIPMRNMQIRIRLYNDAQKITQENVPLIPLVHTKIFVIHNRKVKGIIFYPSTMISYHKVRLES